jgi:hypothetical protein
VYVNEELPGASAAPARRPSWPLLTITAILDAVEERPEHYLNAPAKERGKQLENLDALLLGYDPDGDAEHGFLGAFSRFVRDRYGWHPHSGLVETIRWHSTSDEEAWVSFWRLLRKFRTSR